jgi:hypothetical protein
MSYERHNSPTVVSRSAENASLQKDQSMNRFTNWLRPRLTTKSASARPLRTFRPKLEQLDERLLLSLSSAISIPHSISFHGTMFTWTERDWYTADQSTHQIVEYQGTSRHNVASYALLNTLSDISASVDPNTGSGEVFVVIRGWPSPIAYLESYNSAGSLQWSKDASAFGLTDLGAISATRDGHVYAQYEKIYAMGGQILSGYGVLYIAPDGTAIDLGGPNTPSGTGVLYATSLAASKVGSTNEVFAIGADGAIYVTSGTTGKWYLVDNSASFVSLSANPDNTVFALTTDGKLYQESEYLGFNGMYFYLYWSAQDISGGKHFKAISADFDALGYDEVYAIEQATNTAYLYDQGTWTLKDYDVYDLAAAGGGYFYDVNTDGGKFSGWLYQPNGTPSWVFLDYHLD